MKIIFVSFCFFLIILNSFSQNLQGYITYDMEFYGPPTLKATLHFSENESCFISNKFYSTEERTFSAPGIMVYVEGDTIGKITYKDISKKVSISRQFIRNKGFVVNDTLSEIDWNLSESTKQIGEYKCQKATTSFKGREYEVWFTPDIPISTGPWKLWGLPGLILEGRDKTGEVIFTFSSIRIGRIDVAKAKFPDYSQRPWLLGKFLSKIQYLQYLKDEHTRVRQVTQAIAADRNVMIDGIKSQWIEKEQDDEN